MHVNQVSSVIQGCGVGGKISDSDLPKFLTPTPDTESLT